MEGSGDRISITSEVIGRPPTPAYSGGREHPAARATIDPREQAEPGRPARQAMARAAADEPARPGPGSGDLDAPPELPRIRPRAAEPRDGPAPLPRAGGAAARPQRAAHRGRLRAGLSRDRAG